MTVGGLAASDEDEVWLASTDRAEADDPAQPWLILFRNRTLELSEPVVDADAVGDLELDGEGGLLLTGHVYDPDDLGFSCIARYDASGSVLWTRVGDEPTAVGGSALAVGPDSFVALTAEAGLRVSKHTLDGAQLWSRSLSSDIHDCAVALAPDGTVFAASSEPCDSCAGSDNDVRLTRFDSDGNCAAHLSFGSATRPASDQGKGVVATDDAFIVVGALRPTPQTADDRWDIAVRKYAR